MQKPDGTANTYLYSADGKRQKQVTAGGTVNFVRDGENVLLETDANLITQAHYTDFPGAWGGLASERRGSTSSFYLFDSQSNARDLVSAAGAVTDSYVYKAFGEELVVSGATANPFRFGGLVGYYRDTPSRLYVRARHLRTDLGRWLSRDPAGGGPPDNPYGYAEGNPVGRLDPSGRLAVVPIVPPPPLHWSIGRSSGPQSCCGEFGTYWKFRLGYADGLAPYDGWIVQEVTWVTAGITACPAAPITTHAHYLEAWPVGQNTAGYHPPKGITWDDQFVSTFGERSTRTGSQGTSAPGTSVTGAAKFLRAGVAGVPPYDPKGKIAGWPEKGNLCSQFAGVLACLDIPPGPPAWWTQSKSADDGTSATHGASSWWCCCLNADGTGNDKWWSYSTATARPPGVVAPC